jgi:hypothetical protein
VTGSKLLPTPKLTNHPVDVGQRTEAAILSELVRRGYAVLLPFGVNQRYDLVLDLDGKFVRCQCKTGRLREGAVHFSARSTCVNTRGSTERDYRGQADLFLVYCEATGQIYAVPVDAVARTVVTLRLGPTRNGQRRRVRFARDYELPA